MQEPEGVNDVNVSRSTSLETLSDDEFYDCAEEGDLSPASLKNFLQRPGAPTKLPNNDSSNGNDECAAGPSCGLCTKLIIPPNDPSAWSLSDSGAVVCVSPNHADNEANSGSPLDSVGNSPQSQSSDASTPHRRKPSLKSPTSSAPDTPRRKSVRFADALGLDLQTVKHILENEISPDYPNIAFGASKQVGDTLTILPRYISIIFQQPGGQHDFISRVYKQNVCLENAVVSDFTILGTVKVRNINYHKTVKIRYSCDGWRTYGDVPASYVHGSCDGPMDRFSFGLSAPRDLPVGGGIEFCVCFIAGETEYWDNNYGHNYRLECNAQAETLVEKEEGQTFWTHFL